MTEFSNPKLIRILAKTAEMFLYLYLCFGPSLQVRLRREAFPLRHLHPRGTLGSGIISSSEPGSLSEKNQTNRTKRYVSWLITKHNA